MFMQVGMKVSVIGGGIAGLTTAHYLAKVAKVSSFTLYEASQQLGVGFKRPRPQTASCWNTDPEPSDRWAPGGPTPWSWPKP